MEGASLTRHSSRERVQTSKALMTHIVSSPKYDPTVRSVKLIFLFEQGGTSISTRNCYCNYFIVHVHQC